MVAKNSQTFEITSIATTAPITFSSLQHAASVATEAGIAYIPEESSCAGMSDMGGMI